MTFTDDDLKQLVSALADPDVNYVDSLLCADDVRALLARLEAAELALEDADCSCRGDNTEDELADVCRFFKRKLAWRRAKGEKGSEASGKSL